MALPLRILHMIQSEPDENSRSVVAGIVTEGNFGIGFLPATRNQRFAVHLCHYFAGLGRQKKRMKTGGVSPQATVETGCAR